MLAHRFFVASRIAFAAAITLLVTFAAHAQSAAAPTPDDRARQWLTQVDDGSYLKAFADAAPSFRNKYSSNSWAATASKTREPLGAMASRNLSDVKLSTGGQTVVVRYDSSFAQ